MMKKLLLAVLIGLMIAGSASALYVTTNYAQAQWNSTAIVAGGNNSTDYMQVAGCTSLLLTTPNWASVTSAEVVWYLGSADTVVSREGIFNGTARNVKSPRAKVILYSTPGGSFTAEAYAYN